MINEYFFGVQNMNDGMYRKSKTHFSSAYIQGCHRKKNQYRTLYRTQRVRYRTFKIPYIPYTKTQIPYIPYYKYTLLTAFRAKKEIFLSLYNVFDRS